MKNTIVDYQRKDIIAGDFPVLGNGVMVETIIEEGDIVGISTTGTYGKYDEATYTEAYAIAYNRADAGENCDVILTGEITETYINFPTGKEETTKQALRKISIFVR